jgi:hypothetical protein
VSRVTVRTLYQIDVDALSKGRNGIEVFAGDVLVDELALTVAGQAGRRGGWIELVFAMAGHTGRRNMVSCM